MSGDRLQERVARYGEQPHCGRCGNGGRTRDVADERYLAVVEQVFASCEAHVIDFPNLLTGGDSANTVYVARAQLAEHRTPISQEDQ